MSDEENISKDTYEEVYQVGLGVFRYPAARHSRFEHSLGVVAIADRMIQSLKNQDLDFLRYTDKTIEALIDKTDIPFNDYGNDSLTLGYLVRRVKDRYLPKRCFEINSRVLEASTPDPEVEEKQRQVYTRECIANIEKAKDLADKEAILSSYATDVFEFTEKSKKQVSEYKEFIAEFSKKTYKQYTQWIRKEIADEIAKIYNSLGKPFPTKGITIFDVHMVVPKSIDEQMTFSTPIVYRNAEGHTTTDMLSYTKNWAHAFNSNKWSGYVFVSPHIDITIAFMATKNIIMKHMPNVTLNNPEEFVKRLDDGLIHKIEKAL